MEKRIALFFISFVIGFFVVNQASAYSQWDLSESKGSYPLGQYFSIVNTGSVSYCVNGSTGGNWYGCRAKTEYTTGKYYWETALVELNNNMGNSYCSIGISSSASGSILYYAGSWDTSYGIIDHGAIAKYDSNGQTISYSQFSPFTTDTYLGHKLDLDNNTYTIINSSGSTIASWSIDHKVYFPSTMFANDTCSVSLYSTLDQFALSLPNGYTPLGGSAGSQSQKYSLSSGETCLSSDHALTYTGVNMGAYGPTTYSTGQITYSAEWWNPNSYNSYNTTFNFGSGTNVDVIEIKDAKEISFVGSMENPDRTKIIGNEKTKETFIAITSLRSGALQDLDYIEFTNAEGGQYDGKYVEFVSSNGEILDRERLYFSGSSLIAQKPKRTLKRPKYIYVRGIVSLEFDDLIAKKIATTSSKTDCYNSNQSCYFRNFYGSGFECVSYNYSENLPGFSDTSGTCEIKNSACVPAEVTNLELPNINNVYGTGGYVIDGSGNVTFVGTGRTTIGFTASDFSLNCKTEGKAWYELPGVYLECLWDKSAEYIGGAIDPVFNQGAQTINTIAGNIDNDKGLKNWLVGTGTMSTGTTIDALKWIETKKMSDVGSGWINMIVNSVYVILGMVFLTILILFFKPPPVGKGS